MTANDVLALFREIAGQAGSYRDDKIEVVHFFDNNSCWNWRAVLKTDPPTVVYSGGEWGGAWIHGEFHPGRWCDYLRETVLPAVIAERRRVALGQQVSKEQHEAKRFAPVDDAALFAD